jgi:hypothetical protein
MKEKLDWCMNLEVGVEKKLKVDSLDHIILQQPSFFVKIKTKCFKHVDLNKMLYYTDRADGQLVS